ncbi:MAG: hypothetical protein RBR77_04410 [Thauera sp.]|jgi:hypothetical protein|nr:hypothetical protein [Thauera sp.]
MDHIRTFLAVNEPDFNECPDERPFLALPVGSQFDVLASHPGQVSIWA